MVKGFDSNERRRRRCEFYQILTFCFAHRFSVTLSPADSYEWTLE